MASKKGGLGKGLEAIFAKNDTEDQNATVTLKLSDLEPNREQPRREFKEESLMELADSISRHGILQPLLVRPLLGGGYQIVAGERRWRAARMAGLTEVPAVIRELDESQVMELALIENLQREDLSPLEEAQGYATLIETYGFTQEEVAETVGKSRPAVTNALRLMKLPEEIRSMLEDGSLSAGHARALLSLPEEETMVAMARLVKEKDLSVRQVEALVKKASQEEKRESLEKKKPRKNPYFSEAELALHEHLGRKVTVNGTKKRGVLQIEFYGEEDLKELLKLFS